MLLTAVHIDDKLKLIHIAFDSNGLENVFGSQASRLRNSPSRAESDFTISVRS